VGALSDVDLGAEAKRLGFRLNWVARCGSTNDLAMQALRGGVDRVWTVTDEQVDGRGRMGRPWTPRPGNLYASLGLIAPALTAESPQIGFVAALAAHDAATRATGATRFGLKWPNDLLLDRRKVAGILVEGTMLADGRLAVAVGVGVNVVDHPDGTRYGASDLAAVRPGVTAAQTFAALSDAFALRLAQWRGEGFAAIRAAWLERAVGLGELVRVNQGDDVVEGRFEGIDAGGRLLMRCADGSRRIDAGDVFLAGMI
jgi:BirA family biotin operon repressor/biotin-[acetyl-CoA-carboxylase] ligase